MPSKDESIHAPTRQDWRDWLEANHASKDSIWLIIYHKKSKVSSVYYDEAVEEALCFGWIDSKPNKRDEKSYYLFFAKRKAKSNWSRKNRERVERMLAQGKITPAGQAMIDLAKQTGSWTALEEVENGVIPKDLHILFDQNQQAFEHFQAFPPSSKRIILEWIMHAKRPATRQKRIEETVRLAAQNIRANHYRQ